MWALRLRRGRLGCAGRRALAAGAASACLLAGPLVCATSQAVNDWFDRDVDAINEPQRPIPSGRMPGRWGLYIAVAWTAAVAAGGAGARALGLRRRRAWACCWPGPTARRRCG
ncbi:MAG: UbiA family prenyltransferase [Comamonadaceae bacterium]|nr:UbiA family prenyltransferase [Comamonadaceae bacterium]